MKNVMFIITIIMILMACTRDNEIIMNKDEYNYQLTKNEELKKINEELRMDNQNLLQRYRKIQDEYNILNRKYLNIKNLQEIIAYEEIMENSGLILRTNKIYVVIEDSMYNLLFDYYGDGEYIFGLTVIEGYYTKLKKAWWDNEEIDFDGFVITSGKRAYLDSITKLQLRGNWIYDINENGNPVSAIKMDQINDTLRNKIINSNKNERIQLKIFLRQPVGSDNVFPTFIEILDIIE